MLNVEKSRRLQEIRKQVESDRNRNIQQTEEYYDVIINIARRERNDLRTKTTKEEDAIRLYNIQADLLDEIVAIKSRMIKTLKSIRHSISLMKSFTKEDITNLIDLADQFVPKLRDLSDVAELLEKYDVPFYKNFYKS